jgi:hypothetical protein
MCSIALLLAAVGIPNVNAAESDWDKDRLALLARRPIRAFMVLVPTAKNQPDDRGPSRAIGWPSLSYQSDSQEKFNVWPANGSGSKV